MPLYRAQELLAEGVAIPEFYVDRVGLVEDLCPNLRVTFCAPSEVGGNRVLLPQVALIRPMATLHDAWNIMTNLNAREPVVPWPIRGLGVAGH